ncbi:class I SAM-dependent methyltransferase [Leucobacter denitrificans]|uniref:Class I SAM-dependent methyltransferase n=2 Tax=Leucobacter denitrificans TaxID=683042 RepID=A0A7G9S7Q3_9MICO|nr:class I SAM-dependent methyltransferase [Leucobacter denitrificans]
MLFTPAGLEQASRLAVAELHATRFATAGAASVADLGCGLGAESLAFLRAGMRVRAVEIDALTAEFARHNLAVQASALESAKFDVLLGDATEVGAGDADAVFLDPARRTSGHRNTKRVSSADYAPSLDFTFGAARAARSGGVKLGPGFERELIPEDAEAQWVSIDGALVEMSLWFGEAARPGIRRVATVIHSGSKSTGPKSVSELTSESDSEDAPAQELGTYLYEPDGAVIRSRLIGKLARDLHAGMLHEHIAYLTSETLQTTPFAQAFRIVEELPFREKDLKRALQARSIGKLEIKKRGVDVDPAALRTRLRLKGENSATLILTRSASKHLALLAERC